MEVSEHDLAKEKPEILARLKALAKEARTPPKIGKTLDPSKGFRRK